MRVLDMPRAPSRTYRLDLETLALMAALAHKLGVAQTDVLRMAVRRLAAVEDIARAAPAERAPELPAGAGDAVE
jgi:hypothetical protein